MSTICLAQLIDDFDTYPKRTWGYSPSEKYPEYPWDDETLSQEENIVYKTVRDCLRLAGFDKEHYGSSQWNPLGDIISEGDVVLLKPNWVNHENGNNEVKDSLACLVTNPSVVRVILDYAVIALNGTGKIIVGDAPIQYCNLERMFDIVGYNELFSFYNKQGISLEVQDFRNYHRYKVAAGVISSPSKPKNTIGSLTIDIGSSSLHAPKDLNKPKYKVTNYTLEEMATYHSEGKHAYEINKTPIEADVIINIPKPKSHRLAGLTAAVKNVVGITYNKACLPHRIEGDKAHGGDAYLKKSFWKERMDVFDEKRTIYSISGNYKISRMNDLLMKACYVLGWLFSGDKYRIGSWYGNDTIWRTAVDLNNILLHADKQGIMQKANQRSILTIADMFICGQNDGPISPKPKKLGMVMISDNPLLFDYAMCEIMQFNRNKLPMFGDEQTYKIFGYKSRRQLEKEDFICQFGGVKSIIQLQNFVGKKEWGFEPHSCWKGHIEKR